MAQWEYISLLPRFLARCNNLEHLNLEIIFIEYRSQISGWKKIFRKYEYENAGW